MTQFPLGTFVENIAVRQNGLLLVTLATPTREHHVVQVDPLNKKRQPAIVASFPINCTGITEVDTDVFYVNVGPLGEVSPVSAIYKIDVSAFAANEQGYVQHPATVSKLLDIPDARFLNGATTLNRKKGIILVADSFGLVYRIDVRTATATVLLKDPLLERTGPPVIPPGINGVKVFRGYLYMDNSAKALYLRAKIDSDGVKVGPIEVVKTDLAADDFVIDQDGSAYLTTHITNEVLKLSPNGVVTVVAGSPGDTLVAGTSAAAFGRTPADQRSLYVTTDGGLLVPTNGVFNGGRVLKIDLGYDY